MTNCNVNSATLGTQTERILSHLLAGGSITALQALDLYNCSRLAARIEELKRGGWPIVSRLVETGGGKRVSSYWMDLDAPWNPVPDEDDPLPQGRQGSLDLGGGC